MAAYEASLVRMEVPYSAFPRPEETFWTWWRPFALLFVFFVTTATLLFVVLPLLPFILVGTCIRRFRLRFCTKYHRLPKHCKIAVIGGGWTSLSCIARLKQLGVEQIQAFERYDELGGVWHPQLKYCGQAVHGPMHASSFPEFPYSTERDVMDGKIRGDVMQDYMIRYSNEKDVRKHFRFQSTVKGIHYDTKTQQATLKVQTATNPGSKTETIETGPFDLVIHTAMCSEPVVPQFPEQENFRGDIIHSQALKGKVMEKIIAEKKKVVVLGASKTATDLVMLFQSARYEANVTWLYRRPYLFVRFEYLFGPPGLYKVVLGVPILMSILLSFFFPPLAALMLWSVAAMTSGDGSFHLDLTRFLVGVLSPDQRRSLRKFPRENTIQADIRRLTRTGIELTNGDTILADVILLGTSTHSGLTKNIQLVKDGREFHLHPCEPLRNRNTFRRFPVLSNAAQLFTAFGPVRGYNTAELGLYQLCLERKEPVYWLQQWGFDRVDGGVIQSKFLLQGFVGVNLSLMMTGLLDIWDFLDHWVNLLCFGNQKPLKLDIFPSQHEVAAVGSE